MKNEAIKAALKGLREEMLKKMFARMEDSKEESKEDSKEKPELKVEIEVEKEEEDDKPKDAWEKALMDDYYKTEARKKKNAEDPGMMKAGMMNIMKNPNSFEGPKKKGK